MAKKCVRSCSISILIRENKIKLTARYHCTLTKMAWIEKIYNTKYCRASKTSEYLLIKYCIEVSDKFRHKSTYDQTNSNPVYISKKKWSANHKNLCKNICSNCIHNSFKLETIQFPPKGDWINKSYYNNVMEYFSAIEMNKLLLQQQSGWILKQLYWSKEARLKKYILYN